eukprot:TRINITY_DN16926_c0_g1_i1.p1 TRINITY_DN16926_c0_g1~~TRINITY_DN16926_c0_g1_i1.p1  ORF type:complete len:2141 (+),score=493.84 TRINITY_DN16926_c0_g1_i1:35-6457(+)
MEDGEASEPTQQNDEGSEDVVIERRVLGLAARAAAVEALNSRFHEKPTTSCFCLSEDNTLRAKARDITEHPYFQRGILILIVVNSITLALDSPDLEGYDDLQAFLFSAELVFVSCFALEAILKIIALGFWGSKTAYARNVWNCLDFVIVLVGVTNVIMLIFEDGGSANISGIRLLRILRPLRTVSRVSGMRSIIATLALSLPMIADVFLLLLFLILVFAIAGIQLWSSTLHRRCYITEGELDPFDTTPCSTAATGRSCSSNATTCLSDPEVYKVEYINFDHMGTALLFVFRIVSLDDWPEDLWLVQDTYMHAVWIYFFILILTSSYFAVNLFLAVLSAIFTLHESEQSHISDTRLSAVVDLLRVNDELTIRPENDIDLSPKQLEDEGSLPPSPRRQSMAQGALFRQSAADLRRQSMAILAQGGVGGLPELPRGESVRSVHVLSAVPPQNTYSVIMRDQGALVLHAPRGVGRRQSMAPNALGAPPPPLPTLSQKSLLPVASRSSAQSKSSSLMAITNKEPVTPTPSRTRDYGVEVESVGSGSESDGKASLLSVGPDVCTPPMPPSENPLKNRRRSAEVMGAEACTASHVDVNWSQASDEHSGIMALQESSNSTDVMEMSSPFAETKILMIPPSPVRLASTQKDHCRKSSEFAFVKKLRKKCNSMPVSLTPRTLEVSRKQQQSRPVTSCPLDKGAFKRYPSSQPPVPSQPTVQERKMPQLMFSNPPEGTTATASHDGTGDGIDNMVSPRSASGMRRSVTWRRRRRTNSSVVVAGSLIPPQWEVAVDMSAFSDVDPVLVVQCKTTEDITRCRRICIKKGYGGFSLTGGLASFREETGEECGLGLTETPGTSFHVVTLWEERKHTDAFPENWVQEMEVEDDLEACVQECMHMGYGGFSVVDGVARFKEQRSEECREGLVHSANSTFYLIKKEGGWRIKVRALVMHPMFERVMLMVTILNVVALGADHHGIDSTGLLVIEIVNIVCTLIFTIEIVVKMIGLGVTLTFRDPYNRFDAFLVVVGVPQLIISFVGSSTGGGNFLSIFKMMRVARVLRLGRRWTRLRETIRIVLESLTAVAYLSLLLLLILFIYSILGMQLFGKSGTEDRLNFTSLWRSLLTVFVVVTGEGWVKVLKNTMKAVGWPAAFYFVSLFIIGRYIILNLFVAIIIERFQNKREDEERVPDDMDWVESDSEHTVSPPPPESTVDEPTTLDGRSPTESREKGRRVRSVFELKLQGGTVNRTNSTPTVPTTTHDGTHSNGGTRVTIVEPCDEPYDGPVKLSPEWFGDVTCGCIEHTNPIRVHLTPIITSPLFDKIIIAIIALNLLVLAFENPSTKGDFGDAFNWMDLAFTLLFVLEMAAKLAVLGTWNTKHAYLRDLWNVVDFVVVLTSVLGQFVPIFRVFRSFRVFRLITRSENAKVVLYATVGAVPSVMNGLVVSVFAFVLFAILGVQLFKGDIVVCSDSVVAHRAQCNGTFVNDAGHEERREWNFDSDSNFNNVGEALFTLFKVSLSESWVDIMFAAVDSNNYDTGPTKDSRPAAALYFVCFYVIANFLCLNLIISILISTFSIYHEARFIQNHEEEEKDLFGGWETDTARFEMMRHRLLTDGQKRWVRSQQLLARDIHYTEVPKNKFRRRLHKLASSPEFEWVVAGVIVANLVLLASQHRASGGTYNTMFSVCNRIFIGLYCLEFVIKLLAFTWSGYWQDGWNRFDFFVLFVSLIGAGVGENLTLFRVFRIGRVLRLFHMSKGLAKMFTALLYALPPLFNIGLLLVCVFFVFGVIGVDVFGELDLELNPYLNRNMNFRNLPEASLLLFQVSTGELWLNALKGCRVSEPYCKEGECGSGGAVPYFVFFMVVVSFLMVNLFVAVVLEAFQDAEQVLNNDSLISAFNEFRRKWLSQTYELDHDNDEMDVDEFIELIRATPSPLGPEINGGFLRLLKDLNIPVDTNLRVAYQDVVHALARKVFRITREEAFELAHLSHVRVTDEMFTVAHVYCVRKIGRLWREHGRRRRDSKGHLPAAPFGSITSGHDVCDPVTREPSPFHAFTAFNVQHAGGKVPSFRSMNDPLDSSNANSKRLSVYDYIPHKRSARSTPKTSRTPSEANITVGGKHCHVPTASDIESRLSRFLDAPTPVPSHGSRSRSGTLTPC